MHSTIKIQRLTSIWYTQTTMTTMYSLQFDNYDETRFRNDFKCNTRTIRTTNGDTYHLVTHHSNSVKSGYAKLGQYVTKDMYMDIAMQELERLGKDKKLPKDIVNYIASFISYPSIAEVNNINTALYLRTYFGNSIYKSAIFNEKKQLVCVAPPKPMYSDIFCECFQGDVKYNIEEIDKIYDTKKIYKDFEFYEMEDGIKINAFYDNGKWHLSTIHVIDDYNNHDIATFIKCSNELSFDFERELDKKLCYSFVCRYADVYDHCFPDGMPIITITGIYRIYNEKNEINWLDISHFETTSDYNTRYYNDKVYYNHKGYHKLNPRIGIQKQISVNFNVLKLIVSEWAPGKHLPSEIWENDIHEGRYLQHHSGDKGIIIFHKASGIYTEVMNRNYLHYIIGDKLDRQEEQNGAW
jgi:hypothetical protein